MMRKDCAERRAVSFYQVYRSQEILGGRAAGPDYVYFLRREDTRPDRDGARGHAHHHDPAGGRDQVRGLRQDGGFTAGLDDQRRAAAARPLR